MAGQDDIATHRWPAWDEVVRWHLSLIECHRVANLQICPLWQACAWVGRADASVRDTTWPMHIDGRGSQRHSALVQGLLAVLVVLGVVVSRPIEARLWRAGRITDRTAAVLLLGRFPVLCFLCGLILGAPAPLLLGITVVALVPALLLYRFTMRVLGGHQHQTA